MDVSFTNVLEGARQYFQGLPTATSSTAGPTYNDNEQQVPPCSTAYWPEAARPQRNYQGNYQEQYFPRPQSREVPLQHTQYQYQQASYQMQNTQPQQYHYPQQQQQQQQQQPQQQQQQQQQQQPQQQQQQPQYYPVQAKPQPTSNTTYKPAASQAQLYNPQNYPETRNNAQDTQNYRTHHNLPPIASLSLLSYHSRTNNNNNKSTKDQVNQPPAPKPSASYYYPQQPRMPVVTQNYSYATTNNYTQAMTTSSYQSSSNQQYYQPVLKQKRESPLDLSVKTVRTPADSTLDDVDDPRKYYQRVNTQNYPTYDFYPNSFQRNLTTAPKVEFHPNFQNLNQGYKKNYNYPKPVEYPYSDNKKRPADTAPATIPNKISKVDTWRQSIDQQIEQRLSSYKQQQQVKPAVNGNYRQYQNYQYNNHQTYVPSATAHQYPNYNYQQYQGTKNVGGADKRVLSLLRNSLEIKEAQKKLEQEHKSRLDVQHPTTDVTAPLQPKPGFVNRQNVSPFTPTNLPENTSMYKLHIPKAVDSVNYETETGKIESHDLDGLAAFLAARIRTKAELKQVGPLQSKAFPPRRRLFSRSEDDPPNAPPRDKSGLRSSSETSVFDFPDSEGEEMPVLEAMRRERKVKKPERATSPDDDFINACDSFMEQLKSGSGKKRGRRKKLEADVLAKLETVTREKPIEVKKEEEDDSDVPLSKIEAKTPKGFKKPSFGDGSHFYPGWEEEVYRYKKSLRMPANLIQVTRPPQCHRLSTSLPDLDPYPPSPKVKIESIDSDSESNQSFNIFKNNYDSEGSSSVKSLTKDSILDKLLERYGGKKRKYKKKDETCPKTTPKNEKVELLNTPGLEKAEVEFRQKTENFKEVFLGKKQMDDRPASAPPVTCLNAKIKEEPKTDDFDTKQVLKSKLLDRTRRENLLKSLVDRKIKTELFDDQDSKSETPSIDDECSISGKKHRNKFRNIRRKFSSGFDYIRKKKKHKKENQENEKTTKKRGQFVKANSGSVQDIQKEIKGWVLNKGIGETILHRAARLGYTDITAYCLEKMEYSPSPKDNAGYTPLHEASTKGHLGIAKMLLLYGANVSESARGGIRPLHEAVENGFVEVVRLLLSFGADPKLATYSGMTPLSLATEESTQKLLQSHISDIEGTPTPPWTFNGPSSLFDGESGFNVFEGAPEPDPSSEEEDVEFEMSECLLPNLYTLRGEPPGDRWVLLQDLSNLLKIKSRDALLRQISPPTPSTSTVNHKSVLRELKMSDFLDQAHCCQFLNSGEKVNTRASKIALVKYTDKVKELLNVEKVTISVR